MKRSEHNGRGFSRVAMSCFLALALGLAGGCATVAVPAGQQPFDDYQSAVADLKQQADQALQQVADAELAQFKRQAADDPAKVLQLALEFPPDQPFGWCYASGSDDQVAGDDSTLDTRAAVDSAVAAAGACTSQNLPLFAKFAQMQQTMASINSQLLRYAGLLVALSGADEQSQFDPVEQARQFDEAATGLLGQLSGLGVNTGPSAGSGLALFSTIAANLADRYLETKRREHLVEVLVAGKAPMNRLVTLSQQAFEIAAASAINEYQNNASARFRAVIGGSASLDDLMAFNQQLQDRLALLNTISGGYGALINAHDQLIAALNQDRSANLGELLAYARDIKAQYEALKANQPPTDTGESP